DRAGGAHDARVQFARVPAHRAVAHPEAPVLRELRLLLPSHGQSDRLASFVRQGDGLRDEPGQGAGVVPGGRLATAVGPVAARLTDQDGGGVRVRGGDHYVRPGDARTRLDEFARLVDDPLRHRDEVADDDGRPGRAVVEYDGLGEEVVEHALVA